MGYSNAGFEVVGVDINPQPRYPFKFHQADALTFPLEGFDAIHASPPCQAHSSLRALWKGKEYPDLIPQTRARLVASGLPYVIENVMGAPMGESGHLIMLCGTMFGLQTPDGRAEIRRHRLFEMSFSIALRLACQHGSLSSVLSVVGHTPESPAQRHRERIAKTICITGDAADSPRARHEVRRRRAMTVTGHTSQTNTVRETFGVDDARAAMGIDWMPMKSLSQAIPPAYTHFIGQQLLVAIG